MTRLEEYFADVLESIEDLAQDDVIKQEVLLEMIQKECARALRGDYFNEEEV
jgi:hypothetical protein